SWMRCCAWSARNAARNSWPKSNPATRASQNIGRTPERSANPVLLTSFPRRSSMKAVVYHGRYNVRVDDVPDPVIEEPRDAIIKVTSTAICGSDLHLYDGYIPEMRNGDILGHEFMGEVVEVGKENKKL